LFIGSPKAHFSPGSTSRSSDYFRSFRLPFSRFRGSLRRHSPPPPVTHDDNNPWIVSKGHNRPVLRMISFNCPPIKSENTLLNRASTTRLLFQVFFPDSTSLCLCQSAQYRLPPNDVDPLPLPWFLPNEFNPELSRPEAALTFFVSLCPTRASYEHFLFPTLNPPCTLPLSRKDGVNYNLATPLPNLSVMDLSPKQHCSPRKPGHFPKLNWSPLRFFFRSLHLFTLSASSNLKPDGLR